jgi:hypothetical protein
MDGSDIGDSNAAAAAVSGNRSLVSITPLTGFSDSDSEVGGGSSRRAFSQHNNNSSAPHGTQISRDAGNVVPPAVAAYFSGIPPLYGGRSRSNSGAGSQSGGGTPSVRDGETDDDNAAAVSGVAAAQSFYAGSGVGSSSVAAAALLQRGRIASSGGFPTAAATYNEAVGRTVSTDGVAFLPAGRGVSGTSGGGSRPISRSSSADSMGVASSITVSTAATSGSSAHSNNGGATSRR